MNPADKTLCKTTAFSVTITLVLVFLVLFSGPAFSANKLALNHIYNEIQPKLSNNSLGMPIWIESTEKDRFLQGDVYGLFDHPFEKVQNLLKDPASFCEISFLHFNTKTCIYAKDQNQTHLISFSGRKFYEPPEKAYSLDYQFNIMEDQPDFLQIILSAKKGPLSTKNYRITLTAMPVEGNKTFIHFGYAYEYGAVAGLALSTYLATGGHDKIGFSVTHTDKKGNSVYVDGLRGLIERNAVRYYLAVRAFFDTLESAEAERLQKRLSLWFDLTDQFKAQLFEMEKKEYLRNKLREHQNQTILQAKVNRPAFKYGMPIPLNPPDENEKY